MSDWMKDLITHMPFFVASVSTGAPKLNLTRLLEVLVVIFTVFYGIDRQQQGLRQDITSLNVQVAALTQQVTKLNSDIYTPRWEAGHGSR